MYSVFRIIADTWQYLTSPVFNVSIDTYGTPVPVVIAGERTRICTMTITFPENVWLRAPREEIDVLRPSFVHGSANSVTSLAPDVDVECGEDTWVSDRQVTIDIRVRVTSAATYFTTFKFPKNVYINFTGPSKVEYTVRPSEPKSIELIRIKRFPGHGGKDESVYRGGSARIYLKIKDEFQNTYVENDLKFNITQASDSFTLTSTDFDDKECCYVVTLSCDVTGIASFNLSLPSARPSASMQIEIISPPVSALESYIPQRCIDQIERMDQQAGIPVTLKLVLRDIFGNLIPYEERKEIMKNIRLDADVMCSQCETFSDRQCAVHGFLFKNNFFEKEENSLKLCELELNSNECELEFTPSMAGIRLVALFIAEDEVKNSPTQITVVPGPLVEIRIVSHEPSPINEEIVSYPTEQRLVIVKGVDEFGNKVILDPEMWCLEITGETLQMPKTILDAIPDNATNTLTFQYAFNEKAKYTVNIKPKNASQSHAIVPSFMVEVASAPLDTATCHVSVCQEQPIFTGEFRPLQIQLVLYDCTSGNYEFKDLDITYLTVEVSDEVCHHTFRRGNGLNEVYLTVRKIIDGGEKQIQVMYKDEPLGGQLYVDVDGVIPYDEHDYLELEEYCNEIRCEGVPMKILIGADHANVNNINRVLLKNKNLPSNFDICHTIIEEPNYPVLFDLNEFPDDVAKKVFQLLSLLVEGAHHYRTQAKEFDDEREIWKTKANRAFHDNNHEVAGECKAIKEEYGRLMDESHRLASDAIFAFYNDSRHDSEIDLHGQLVADEDQLNRYRQQLLSNRNTSSNEVDAIIETERNKGNEAIRKLREHLTTLNEGARRSERDWLEIIDGAGHHSAEGQRIRPKVEQYLRDEGISYIEANQGALLITFSEYNGKEPCFANFYCTECKKTWMSNSSWKGCYQQCYRCDSNETDSRCNPFKLRSSSPSRSRHTRSKTTTFYTREDHIRLCQKCQELGRDCSYA